MLGRRYVAAALGGANLAERQGPVTRHLNARNPFANRNYRSRRVIPQVLASALSQAHELSGLAST